MHSSVHTAVGKSQFDLESSKIRSRRGPDVASEQNSPDFIDSGQWVHDHHLLLGHSHDVGGEDELAETLQEDTNATIS